MTPAHLKPVPKSITEIPFQPASLDIWGKKYRLKAKDGTLIDRSIDDTYKRLARALADVEKTQEQREKWYQEFLWALRRGVIPAGRIVSNAGAWAHKPATSTINCTVSGVIHDSMDDILHKVHEAGLTLKAGCVAPGTWIFTEKGLVTAERAVAERHGQILSYDRESGRFEMRPILKHMTTRVPRAENIEITSNGVTLKTSIKHPVLVYRTGKLVYVRADEVTTEDALVHCSFPWAADKREARAAWLAGAYLGKGSAYEKRMIDRPTRWPWAQRVQALGKRLVFKIWTAQQEMAKRYAVFSQSFCPASEVRQDDGYVLPVTLKEALQAELPGLSHAERESLGFCHGYHRRATVSRIRLERWEQHFPALSQLIGFAHTLRPVQAIRRNLPLSELFYDFTVDKHNNYLAGNGGLMVIHNCGIGYEFSTLRPRGAYVSGAGAYTSGPLSFMDIYDKMCFTVSSAGGRRGAQMGTFDVGHPDVLEFIRAKREDGRLRQFNLSLLITQEFMEAVKNDALWKLAFPLTDKEATSDGIDLNDPAQVVWRDWPYKEDYVVNGAGKVACRIYKTIRARRLWDVIMSSTYDYAEPGFILIDKVNEMNNNWFCENIRATNPCAEQPLPPYGSCWTGAMRLNTNFGLIKTEDAYALVQQGVPLSVAVDHIFTGNKTELRPCTLVQNGLREVFEVAFSCGLHIELTADHRVFTPQGWRAVRELKRGDQVNIHTREMSNLQLVNPFYLGVIKYLLNRHAGDDLVVTRQNQRSFLRPILELLRVNYRDCVQGLYVSRTHPVIREVESLDLNEADSKILEGFLYAASATCVQYKGKKAIYGDQATCTRVAWAIRRITDGVDVEPIRCRKNTYRLVLPELGIVVPPMAERALNLDYAVFGWLLAQGWLMDSAGLVFNGQEDGAMELLAPPFKAMTGTEGWLHHGEWLHHDKWHLGLSDDRSWTQRVPEWVFRADSQTQTTFLAAVFCAHGSIDQHALSIRLVSSSRNRVAPCKGLADIQLLLLNFGIHATLHPSLSKGNVFYILCLHPWDTYRFYRFIGFPFSRSKQERLEQLLEKTQRWQTPAEDRITEVADIQPLGVQPVYDIEEFSSHTLIVNGVVVHNCLLGSVNLTRFVVDPFTERARFDWEEFRKAVAIFTRMLDNVVEINGLALDAQCEEIMRKRRHGMGYLGLGSTLTLLRMKYGAPESLAFTERVTRELALVGWQTALALAKERGPAPIMEEKFTVTSQMLSQRPEMAADGWKAGATIKGKVLYARYSRYMQRLAELAPELSNELSEVGARFTHHSSIAPTGTISLSLANNASNGIEPSFAHHYFRNVIRERKKSKEKVDVYSFELLAYRELVNPKANPYSQKADEQLPDYFITAEDITPREHVDIQAAAQKWIDSSISKTANVPTDYPYEDFKDIYLYAYEQGLKGCTTFRFNPEAFQGVLVKEKDLKNTTYRFTLADGTVVEARGDEEIEYDGEIHTAANLYDALKEGYYGKW
jgi:Ribonucleotide reductase, alpha subunit